MILHSQRCLPNRRVLSKRIAGVGADALRDMERQTGSHGVIVGSL